MVQYTVFRGAWPPPDGDAQPGSQGTVKRLLRSTLAFIFQFCGNCIACVIEMGLLYCLIRIPFALWGEDWAVLGTLTTWVSMIGLLYYGVPTVVLWFSDPMFVDKEFSSFSEFVDSFADALDRLPEPRLINAARFAQKHYSRARPSRRRRAAIGAAAGAALGGFWYWLTLINLPHVHPPFYAPVVLVLIPTIYAGIAGARTDSV